jgi:hypothetical protein
MKVLSFSLYGNNPLYTIGAIKNSILHNIYFSDWEMWVYHNDTVPTSILDELITNGVRLINTNEDLGFVGSLWRFYAAAGPDVEYFISRDCDSRISERDVTAVSEWVDSKKSFHIIRDHPVGHGWNINAGMWGSKSIPNMKFLVKEYINHNPRYNDKSLDQCFLRDVIYPNIDKENDLVVHDEYFNYEGIGVAIQRDRKLDDFAFIGESVDENDNSRYTHTVGDQRSPIKSRYGG